MKNIYQNRIIHVIIIFIAATFLFGCKTKYEHITDRNIKKAVYFEPYGSTESRAYLIGPYLKLEMPDNGNVIQVVYRIITYDTYSLDEPRMWGLRMGKYKNNKQEGTWISESSWYPDRQYHKYPYKRREEHFKDGLQHGDYIIYNSEGDVIYYTEFINGTGIEKDYHPNGQLYYEISKKDGYFTDTLKLYDEGGRLYEMLYFEKDSLVFSKEESYSRRRVLEKERFYRSIDHLLFPRIDSKK